MVGWLVVVCHRDHHHPLGESIIAAAMGEYFPWLLESGGAVDVVVGLNRRRQA